MRYLVTGGAGFLGSALAHRLVADGHRVRVLDDFSRGRPERLAGVVDVVEADIRDAVAVSTAARDVDSVCHLAFINGTEFFYSNPQLVLDVAVRGMLSVVDACREQSVGQLVLVSSSEVYQTPPTVPTDESAPLSVPDPHNPRYSYAGGKIISELLALHSGLSHVLIVRPHNVYGPGAGPEHVISALVHRARALPGSSIRLQIQGDGSETRTFVYVDDFINGLRLVMARGEHREIYNIGTEAETSIAEVARLVGRALGKDVVLVPGPRPEGGALRRCPDIAKLRALGYAPRVSLEEGIGRL